MAWRITDYNMQSISHKTEASINREYNRLRKIVEKRVATFEKHGNQVSGRAGTGTHHTQVPLRGLDGIHRQPTWSALGRCGGLLHLQGKAEGAPV